MRTNTINSLVSMPVIRMLTHPVSVLTTTLTLLWTVWKELWIGKIRYLLNLWTRSVHDFDFLRFAQFFLEPLFTESATMREACAVHSEHTKNIAQDDWRFSQIKRLLSEPGHPYSKFGTGNTDTLVEIPKSKGINVREVSQTAALLWNG